MWRNVRCYRVNANLNASSAIYANTNLLEIVQLWQADFQIYLSFLLLSYFSEILILLNDQGPTRLHCSVFFAAAFHGRGFDSVMVRSGFARNLAVNGIDKSLRSSCNAQNSSTNRMRGQ
jgi:hypothetical protein